MTVIPRPRGELRVSTTERGTVMIADYVHSERAGGLVPSGNEIEVRYTEIGSVIEALKREWREPA